MNADTTFQDRNATSAVQRASTLVVLLLVAAAVRHLGEVAPGAELVSHSRLAFLLGFVLLAGHLAGSLAKDVGLPRITGFLVLGVAIGPGVLGLISAVDVAAMSFLDAAAISLIALSAGGELKVSDLRRSGRTIFGVMTLEMVAVFVAMGALLFLLAGTLPFTQGQPAAVVAVIALVFATIAIANSPAVTVAVVNDQDARGPVTSTILGVTVLKDVVIIVFFAAVLSFGRSALDSDGAGLDILLLKTLWWEVAGSMAVGALLGWGISRYLRDVRVHLVLFVLGVAFVSAFVAGGLRLEVLLMSLTAGFFVENVSPERGEPFIRAVEANSIPVYALFFTLAGASIDVAALASLWPVILLIGAVRAGAIYAGIRAGASLSGAPDTVRRYAWTGFISQAGVTLGMVTLAAQAFPDWGPELKTLFVSLVALHELVGPPLLQWGLGAADEVGRREEAEETVRPESAPGGEGGARGVDDDGHGGISDPPFHGDGVEALREAGQAAQGHRLVHS
jgi:Kef-type K+ transport system membrane component KefB